AERHLDHAEALVQPEEALVDPLETVVDPLETLVDPLETVVDPLERGAELPAIGAELGELAGEDRGEDGDHGPGLRVVHPFIPSCIVRPPGSRKLGRGYRGGVTRNPGDRLLRAVHREVARRGFAGGRGVAAAGGGPGGRR